MTQEVLKLLPKPRNEAGPIAVVSSPTDAPVPAERHASRVPLTRGRWRPPLDGTKAGSVRYPQQREVRRRSALAPLPLTAPVAAASVGPPGASARSCVPAAPRLTPSLHAFRLTQDLRDQRGGGGGRPEPHVQRPMSCAWRRAGAPAGPRRCRPTPEPVRGERDPPDARGDDHHRRVQLRARLGRRSPPLAEPSKTSRPGDGGGPCLPRTTTPARWRTCEAPIGISRRSRGGALAAERRLVRRAEERADAERARLEEKLGARARRRRRRRRRSARRCL